MPLVHAVDARSNNSGAGLVPPTPAELERLTQQLRALRPTEAPGAKHGRSMRSLRRRLAPREIQEIAARYSAGATIRALSLEYDVSRSGLRQLLLGEGVELRRQSTISEDSDHAIKLDESGLTIREVATKIGSPPETLRRELHR